MDELANSFSAFGEVIRAPYQNTYDKPGRSFSDALNVWSPVKVAMDWRRAGADFIHVNKQNLEDGLDLLRAAQLCSTANLCTIHLTQSARYLRAKFGRVRDFVARRSLRRYPGVLVTVLESRRKDLLDFIGPTPRVRTIPNGVPLYDLKQKPLVRAGKRAELGYTDRDLLFLAVGRMVPQKRPVLFLQVARRIHKTSPDVRFLWIGDGPMATEWDEVVAKEEMGSYVRRVAWQSDVQAFLFAADIFLHVAEYEGLPLAILEALSAGLPIAVTENLRSEMTFLDGSNSLSFGEDDAPVVPTDRLILDRLGAAGRGLAEREFSHSKMAESYETLYEFVRRRPL